jgi:hypothetical protein
LGSWHLVLGVAKRAFRVKAADPVHSA